MMAVGDFRSARHGWQAQYSSLIKFADGWLPMGGRDMSMMMILEALSDVVDVVGRRSIE